MKDVDLGKQIGFKFHITELKLSLGSYFIISNKSVYRRNMDDIAIRIL